LLIFCTNLVKFEKVWWRRFSPWHLNGDGGVCPNVAVYSVGASVHVWFARFRSRLAILLMRTRTRGMPGDAHWEWEASIQTWPWCVTWNCYSANPYNDTAPYLKTNCHCSQPWAFVPQVLDGVVLRVCWLPATERCGGAPSVAPPRQHVTSSASGEPGVSMETRGSRKARRSN